MKRVQMESENYYIRNEETGKLNVFTTKPFYDSLNQEQKKTFTKYCLWSSKQQCWLSKAKTQNSGYLQQQLAALGFEDKGSIGHAIPFEDQVKRQQENAEVRAERATQRAEKASEKSDMLFDKAKSMASIIPFGQPILVGHHSEKSDRNYRGRIDNTFRKSFEEQEKSEYYSDKAELARETASGKKFDNPFYLSNRIKECNAHIRRLDLNLLGKRHANSPEWPIPESSKIFYNKRLAEEQEKLEFFTKCMLKINPEYQTAPKKMAKRNKGKGIG